MLLASSGVAGVSGASSKTYIDDYFCVQLRTGNGTSQSVTTGFQPDLIWTKSRSAATGHRLVDSARGAGNSLESNSTSAQQSEATGITALNSSGYSVGADSDYNTSGAAYVDWCWKKAPKFFDVVTGVAGASALNHSLGVLPGMVILKDLGTGAWHVVHRSANGLFYLNTTDAAQYTTKPGISDTDNAAFLKCSTTQFGLNGTFANYPFYGNDIVAYLFAHDPEV